MAYDVNHLLTVGDAKTIHDSLSKTDGNLYAKDAQINDIIRPAIYAENDITIPTAWTTKVILPHIYCKAKHQYTFAFTAGSTLATNGYVKIYQKDGTGVSTNNTFPSGSSTYSKLLTPTSDIEDGYVTISCGDANASFHAEYGPLGTQTALDILHDEKLPMSEPTANLIGNCPVAVCSFVTSGGNACYRVDKNNIATRDMVPCSASTSYAFRAFTSVNRGFNYKTAWYTSDGTLISGSTSWASAGNGKVITSPDTAAFVRFGIQHDNGIPDDTRLMIAQSSSVPSAYVPPLSMYDLTARSTATSASTTATAAKAEADQHEVTLTKFAPDVDSVRAKKNLKEIVWPVVLEQGAFDSDGLNMSANNRLRSRDYIPVYDGCWIMVDVKYSGTNIDVLPIYYAVDDYTTAQTGRRGQYNVTPFSFYCPKGTKYIRLYINNDGATLTPDNATITVKILSYETAFRYVFPYVAEKCFDNLVALRKHVQDIAVYNGHIFDFGSGVVSIDGGTDIEITNGHGNNAQFGSELHGAYPYLYCPSWNYGSGDIYVNQYADGAFTLVDTIHVDLDGHLNACVDEENERIYILHDKDESTYTSDVDFVVADFSGNILSTKTLGEGAIPVIAGMTFHNGHIYVGSGYRAANGYPSCLRIYDTSGNLVSKTDSVGCYEYDSIEGFDIDQVTGIAYLGMINTVLT